MSSSRKKYVMVKGMHALMLFPTTQMEVRIENGTRRKHGILEIKKGRCKLVDANKFARNEPALEHTSMKA
jgi:hypothetical protein